MCHPSSNSLGNTPPDYRTTDMDLSDNEENDGECSDADSLDRLVSLLQPSLPPIALQVEFVESNRIESNRTERKFLVVRTTQADPRHHRKHNHTRHSSHFDDADERPHQDPSKSSSRSNGDKKSATVNFLQRASSKKRFSLQDTPMIDVNAITELLIQHSQSTGFDKSLEMLTQTLRQLTDPNASAAAAAAPNALLPANPLENLLMKSLQTPPIAAPVLPTPMWFNPSAPSTYPSSVPSYFTPQTGQRSNSSTMDFHSQQQQYQNQRN